MSNRLILTLLALALLVSAGAAQAQDASTTIYAHLTQDFDVLDPHLTNTTLGYQMAITFYDRLVAMDDDGNIIPSLATSWEGSGADQLSFTLNSDAVCTDGTPLNAEAVANSLLRMGANDTGSPFMYRTLGGAAGATEERYSVSHDNDAGTVSISMHEPFGALLIGLAMPWASVICPAGIENPDLMIDGPQGSGPYALAESVRGDRYAAQARPDYTWGARGTATSVEGFPQTLVYQVVANQTTAANLFLSGELNIVTVTGADFDRVAAAETFAVDGYSFGAVWLHVNKDEGLIGTDPAIRQAVYKAVSREEYLEVGFGGRGLLTNTFVSPNAVCYDEGLDAEYDQAVGFDPDGAGQILADAGYVLGADGKLADADGNPVILRFVDYGFAGTEGSELIILSLEDVGFTVDPILVEFGGYLERLLRTGEWDVAILPVNPPVPLPGAMVGYFSGGGAINTASTDNQTFNDEYAMANVTAGDESCMHWSNAMRALLENFDFKPLFSQARTYFGQGVEFTLFNQYSGTWDPITTRIVDG